MDKRMYEDYEKALESGEYDNEEELCNDKGLNYSDLYYDSDDDE